MNATKEPDTSASGTTHGYRVEAMCDSDDPMTVSGQTLTRKWKIVHFNESAHGVPISEKFDRHWLAATHTYSYATAQALRWWFHAAAAADRDMLSSFLAMALHTRIVKYAVKYDVSATRESEHAEVNGRDRSPPSED